MLPAVKVWGETDKPEMTPGASQSKALSMEKELQTFRDMLPGLASWCRGHAVVLSNRVDLLSASLENSRL